MRASPLRGWRTSPGYAQLQILKSVGVFVYVVLFQQSDFSSEVCIQVTLEALNMLVALSLLPQAAPPQGRL